MHCVVYDRRRLRIATYDVLPFAFMILAPRIAALKLIRRYR